MLRANVLSGDQWYLIVMPEVPPEVAATIGLLPIDINTSRYTPQENLVFLALDRSQCAPKPRKE